MNGTMQARHRGRHRRQHVKSIDDPIHTQRNEMNLFQLRFDGGYYADAFPMAKQIHEPNRFSEMSWISN